MKNGSTQYREIPSNIRMHHRKGRMDTVPGYHWHNGYEIYLFLGGDVRCSIEQACFTPVRGSLFVIQPSELHRVEVLDEASYERIAIEIRSSYLNELCRNSTDLRACFVNRPLGKENHVTLSEEETLTFTMLAHKLMEYNGSTSYGHEAMTSAALLELLVLTNSYFLSDERRRSGEELPSPVAETMEYISLHLADDLSLPAISGDIHYDSGYISRKFREYTGITVSKYIMYKRVLLARTYMLQGIEPREAALLSGFHDYSVFYRSFIRLSGCAPSGFLSECSPASE